MKRLILKPAIILTTFLTVFAFNIKAQDLNSAILLTRSEQYDKAEELFKQLIQKEPTNGKVFFYLGENYLLDYFADTISNSITVSANAAKEVYQKGTEASPNDPLNYIGLAKVAFYLGDDKTAADMRTKARSFLLPYKNLKKISPPAKDYAFALAKIAESYVKDGKADTSAALPLLREALKIDNKNRDVYLIAGDIYISVLGDGSKAISYYNQAQFADPQSPTASMKIGSIYMKGRALQPAISNFEQAIELNAEFAPAYRLLGQLYSSAGRYAQSKEYFDKYLALTAGNIPAKILYVNALFYSKDYDGVIQQVEEIFKIDNSRNYMNRIAGYSCYEKNPPDYVKGLAYMETLFKTVAPERILWKDYYYLARILLKKNQDYPKMVDELTASKAQLTRDNARYGSASTAEKAKLKPALDALTAKVAVQEKEVAQADSEIDRAFGEYAKVEQLKPQDKNLLNEIAINYFNYRRYEGAARTWSKLLDPANVNLDDYMKIARAYYTGDKFKTCDSVLNVVIQKDPNYIPAYLLAARTYSKMDPDTKLGLAKPKFEKLVKVAQNDSVKFEAEIMEALGYLSYYHMVNDNNSKSKEYYNRMINLNPNNKKNMIRGYNGVGIIETRLAGNEKTIEGRLAILAKAAAAFNKTLSIDPADPYAKSQLSYVRDFEAQVRKGINPNEIKGVIKNQAGQPIASASVRVKDTAAENFTNSRGEFKFEIPAGMEFLIIGAEGYKSIEVPITSSRIYNATLEK